MTTTVTITSVFRPLGNQIFVTKRSLITERFALAFDLLYPSSKHSAHLINLALEVLVLTNINHPGVFGESDEDPSNIKVVTDFL